MDTIKNTISFTRGVPAEAMRPVPLMRDSAQAALDTYGATMLPYGSAWGFPALRQWLADDQQCDVEQVIVGNGSIDILSRIVGRYISYNDAILVENPTYDRARIMFDESKARVLPVPTSTDGLDIEVYQALVAEHRPRFAYLINDFSNPAGTTTCHEKRQRIAQLAQEHDMLIIDDGAYYSLRYDGEAIPPMRHYAPEHTLSLGSFSKLIAPGVRTGWLIAPPPYAQEIATYIENRIIAPNYFAQATVTQAVISEAYQTHLNHLIETYRHRRDLALDLLQQHLGPLGAEWTTPDGGFFIGVYAPPTQIPVWDAAQHVDLQLLNGDEFFTGRHNTNFVRLPFCSMTNHELVEGMERFAEAIRRYAV